MKLTSSPAADVLKQHDAGSVGKSILLITAVSLGTSALLAAVLWAYNPVHLRNAWACPLPDSGAYLSLARNLVLYGEYSRSPGPPYLPEHFVPPVYPAVVGVLEWLGGAAAIYVAQTLLRAATCVLVYLIARPIVGQRAALYAGVLWALDLWFLVFSFTVMTEVPFLFLVAAGLWLSLPVLVDSRPDQPRQKLRLAGGAALLGLAALTRMQGSHLPLLLAMASVAVAWWRGQLRRTLPMALLMLGVSYALASGWLVRNVLLFGEPQTAGAGLVAYYAGPSAYMHHTGVNYQEALQRVAQEYDLPPVERILAPHWFGVDVSTLQEDFKKIRLAAWKLLWRYPEGILITSLKGTAKASLGIYHDFGPVGEMLRWPWVHVDTLDFLVSPFEATSRLLENAPPLWFMFAYHVTSNMAFLVLVAAGIVGMLGNRQTRGPAVVLLGVAAYFYMTMGLCGWYTPMRHRLHAFMVFCCFAGWAASRMVDFYRNWRSRAQPA